MNAIRRFVVVFAAAGLMAAGPGRVASGDAPALGGYDMGAISNAISFIYNQPSFGLPAKPTFEMHALHADTSLDSGPTGHALGSILWPGDVVGNAPAATAFDIFLADPTAGGYLGPAIDPVRGGAEQAGSQFPAYPVRSETTYPPGGSPDPTDMGGGVTMSSKAIPDESSASATLQHAGFPGAFSFGAMHSDSFSGVVKGLAVASAHTHITDVDVAGEIHIAGVEGFGTTSSDGTKATASGSLAITGLTIHGQPMTYDATGLHAGGQDVDPYGMIARDIVAKYLAPQGISISFDKPDKLVDGPQGMLSTAGVVIRLNSARMNELIENVPQPYRGWIHHPATSPLAPVFDQFTNNVKGLTAAPFQFDNDVQIVLGSVAVRGVAAPAFDFSLPPVITPPLILPPPPAPGFEPQPGPAAPPTQVLGNRRTFSPAIRPVAAVGVPALTAAGLLVLLGLVAAIRMRRFADRVGASTGPSCPNDL